MVSESKWDDIKLNTQQVSDSRYINKNNHKNKNTRKSILYAQIYVLDYVMTYRET